MFIIGDEGGKQQRIPWVTGGLIVVNVLAFCLQQAVGEPLTYGFSLVPAEITQLKDFTKPQYVKLKVPVYHPNPRLREYAPVTYKDEWVPIPQYPGPFPIFLTLLTSMFLHVNGVHLVGNMWFLVIFGRNVESALNHGRFLVFYLVCGTCGGLAHILSNPNSVIPCLGASGAISGIMGAYVAVFPLNKIKLWFGLYIGVIELPAIAVLGFWFLWQYVSAVLGIEQGPMGGGIAYWDHLGGFVSGVLIIWGTIAYLKWQLAKEPPAEEEPPPSPESTRAPADDPFRTFLPTKNGASKASNHSEPSYLPGREEANWVSRES